MLVNLRNYSKFCTSDAIEYFDAYENPVVITDLNLKVTAKNKAFKNSGLKLRSGSGFLRFVHEAHVAGLKALAVSQVYNLTLSAGEFNSAAVFRGIDCMAFVLSRDIRHPAESVIEKYSKMSGYDLDINTVREKRVQGMETVLKSMLDTRADFYPLPFFDCKKRRGIFHTGIRTAWLCGNFGIFLWYSGIKICRIM